MSRSPFESATWDRESEMNDALRSLDMLGDDAASTYVPSKPRRRSLASELPNFEKSTDDDLGDLDEPMEPAAAATAAPAQATSRAPHQATTTKLPSDGGRVSTRVVPEVAPQATKVDPKSQRVQPAQQARPSRNNSHAEGAPAHLTAQQKKAQRSTHGDTELVDAIRRRPAPASVVPSKPYANNAVPESRIDRAAAAAPQYAEKAMKLPGRSTLPLSLLILAIRLVAIALCALVVILAVPMINNRLGLIQASNFVSSFMPSNLNGVLVMPTPFGGAFRGDFALAALLLFVIDWILTRLRQRLKWG